MSGWFAWSITWGYTIQLKLSSMHRYGDIEHMPLFCFSVFIQLLCGYKPFGIKSFIMFIYCRGKSTRRLDWDQLYPTEADPTMIFLVRPQFIKKRRFAVACNERLSVCVIWFVNTFSVFSINTHAGLLTTYEALVVERSCFFGEMHW